MSGRKPSAPRGLGERGRKLWRDVLGEYDLTPTELSLLHHAARTLDELDRLEVTLQDERTETLVTGSAGQVKASPLFDEIRKHRETLGRLVERMALPAESEDAGRTPTSRRAQRAAESRWQEHNELERRRRGA